MELVSYLGASGVKEFFVNRMREHKEADELVKGTYWQNGKGCAVGCTIHDSDHSNYEKELGIPSWLAYLEDRIFEGLPNEKAKDFPLDFLEAIPVGKSREEFDLVKYKFLLFIVDSAAEKVKDLKRVTPERREEVLKHNAAVRELLEDAIKNHRVSDDFYEAAAKLRPAYAYPYRWYYADAAAAAADAAAAAAAADTDARESVYDMANDLLDELVIAEAKRIGVYVADPVEKPEAVAA